MKKTKILLATLSIGLSSLIGQDELDLDAMWDNTVWNEIEEVTTKEYEVEKVTTVAGVRGAEAEDEALHHLYYRQSMKGPSPIELNKALGKLRNTLASLKEKKINLKEIPKVSHLKIRARSDNTVGITFARLGNYSMAIDYFKKAINNDPTEMDYKVHLAVALYRMYKYDDALTYYEEVKKAKPELVTQLDFIESMGESTPKFDKFD